MKDKDGSFEDEQTNTDEAVIAEAEQTDIAPVKKSTGIGATIAMLIALVALSASGYLWMQQTELQKKVASRDLQPLFLQLQQLKKTVIENQSRQAGLETLQQQYQQLYVSFQALQKKHSIKPVDDVILVEADALLRFAQQRYVLTHDLPVVIEAMTSAELLLQGRSDVALVEIRQNILAEIKLLQNLKVTDTANAVTMVSRIISQVDRFPLRSAHPRELNAADEKEQKGAGKNTGSVWKGLLKTIQPLVTVRRTSHKTPAMLSAEDERHVRLILKSRLEQLRLSLLQRNEAAVHLLSKQSISWLIRYFDVQYLDALDAKSQLEAMNKLSLSVTYPETGMAWKQLQQFRKQRHVKTLP